MAGLNRSSFLPEKTARSNARKVIETALLAHRSRQMASQKVEVHDVARDRRNRRVLEPRRVPLDGRDGTVHLVDGVLGVPGVAAQRKWVPDDVARQPGVSVEQRSDAGDIPLLQPDLQESGRFGGPLSPNDSVGITCARRAGRARALTRDRARHRIKEAGWTGDGNGPRAVRRRLRSVP